MSQSYRDLKKPFIIAICISSVISVAVSLIPKQSNNTTQVVSNIPKSNSNFKSDQEIKKIATPKQFHILREAGTEVSFSGALNNEKRTGTYFSIGCDVPIFRSEQKYDSGTGWPSFWAPIDDKAVVLRKETGFGDDRTEVLDTCGSHLGHVFDDGPKPTGKRYCMNSLALKFVPDEK